MPQERPAFLVEDRVMVPRSALDHDGYRLWVKSDAYPGRLRTTFIAGEVLVEMTPESFEAHNKIKTALTEALSAFVRERDLGEVYSDRALVTHEAAGLSCEPDLTFVSWGAFEDGRVRLVERSGGGDYVELVGSPDLVVEIVSDLSVQKDTRLLREAYARAGVREYWLIDARGRHILFDILWNTGAGFALSTGAAGLPASRTLGGCWQITRARNRAGRFTYRVVRT